MVLLDKTFNCNILLHSSLIWEPAYRDTNFCCTSGVQVPQMKLKRLQKKQMAGCTWSCLCWGVCGPALPPPSPHPFPPGAQEMEGGVAGEVGGLCPELWPDLWRILRTAVMVQLLCRQLVPTSFGDASALLAETTSSLSPHQTPSWELSWRARSWEQPLVFGG